MAASHGAQDAVAPCLCGQMNPIAQILILIHSGDDVPMKISGEGSGELDARHFRRSYCAQKSGKGRRPLKPFKPCFSFRPVTVDVLADKLNLLITRITQTFDFSNDLGCRAATLTSARIWNDAIGAKLITSFDNGNICDIRRLSLGDRNFPLLLFQTLS